MSPESRTRLGMVRPERVVDVCFDVHACFAEGEPSGNIIPVLHTVALLTLQRLDRLPPHRQSLSVIASNIAGALARLGSLDRRLEGVMANWRFGQNSNGQPYDPHRIRTAVQLVTALRTIDARAFTEGIARYILSIELAKRGLPQTFAMLAYQVLQPPPWAALLECGGVHSAVLWNMTALLGTFSPPAAPAVRFAVADCDRQQEALVRMLAAGASAPIPMTLVESLPACATSPLRFDRIVAIADDVAERYVETCWHLLQPGGKALIALPLVNVERWWSAQLDHALAQDRVEALIQWQPQQDRSTGWLFVVLRTTAPVHQRRRTVLGVLSDPEFSLQRIEELCDTLARGNSTATWLEWTTPQSISALPIPSSVRTTELASLLEYYGDRGLDFGHLTAGNNGSLRLDDRISSIEVLRTAIRSTHGLRTHEMRYYYSLDQWWHRISPLLGQYGRMVWPTVEQSLIEHLLCVPSMPMPAARALGRRWWQSVEPDLWGIEQVGARAMVESILGSIERKLRTFGVKLWKQLDQREEFLLGACVPTLTERVRSELRRQAHQRQHELQQLDERIAMLTAEVAAYRARMSQLHAQAKAHDVPHDTPELIDSTMPLQNELSALLKKMVTAQSELKMLQQNRQLLHTPNTEDWFSPVVARATAQLLPALQNARRILDEARCWSLLLALWEDQLRAVADQQWEAFVADIVADFERWWNAAKTAAATRITTSAAIAR